MKSQNFDKGREFRVLRRVSCLFIALSLFSSGCLLSRDPTIDYVGLDYCVGLSPKYCVGLTSNDFGNGVAHDKAVMDAKGIDAIFIPENSQVVQRSDGLETITIRMEKNLSYMGHPPKPIMIDDLRSKKGFAYAKRDRSLFFSTYGEFLCCEGGTTVSAEFEVPPHIKVVKQNDLSIDMNCGRDVALGGKADCYFRQQEGELPSPTEEEVSPDADLQWHKCLDQPDLEKAEH
ncbi:MAG: hypothetical protein PVH19_01835 [Planctomycetia bacterium]